MVSIQYLPTGRTAKDIADSLEAGVREGVLRAGQQLASVRALAAALDVAPGTVATAYKMLRDRGIVDTNGRHGTQVTQRPQLVTRSETPLLASDVTDLAAGQPDPALLPPLRLPKDLTSAAAPDHLVLDELAALARDKFEADGIPSTYVTVTAGGLDAIQRVLTVRLRPGDLVAIEDPGWPNVLDLVATMGLRPYPLPLDEDGPQPAALQAAVDAGVAAVIVTNRAQNPSGVALTRDRAATLRRILAAQPKILVVEDDHAGDLATVPLATLAGATDAWAFVRSVSKPYGPDLRLAVVAGDDLTVARVDERLRVGAGWVSTILQRLVVALWTDPAATATVIAAGQAYADRRDRLIAALAHRGIPARGATGLNVWIPVPDETSVIANLMQARWAVAPGSRFRQRSEPAIRVTVSGLTAATIPVFADAVAVALSAAPGRLT